MDRESHQLRTETTNTNTMKHEYTKLQAAIAEHKALTADYWAARWHDEVDARNRQYNELECTRAIAEKALTELAKTKENGLSQLRPISEAGEVPEGCVRVRAWEDINNWVYGGEEWDGDTHFADIRLPVPAEKPDPYADKPLVTKPISLPLAECMSLRDWFAGQALTMLADPDFSASPEDTAKLVYRIADAMLKAREVKP